ncbi:DEAD/DEAH box helicase family protein [Oscillibacter valericigenes]|uniref:DEAD/DEAH box helicase family protein n=1 Tax=Oscillibacter valericigenes TaxID=351091 RepID=UPI001F20E6EA|nr:DEAD/DEAH box helicase family protein [Oscillibacter valericigenes]
MLHDYEFLSSYNKLDNDVAQEFYIPCMSNAFRYDRISGYFGSTIYIIAWDALKEFVSHGGKMRVICSPYLSDEDMLAIEEGRSAANDTLISEALKKETEELLNSPSLSKPARLLACLIAAGIIELKIAIITENCAPDVRKLYHDKAGVFSDLAGDRVAFRGSFNETFKGLSSDGNIESADVFQSWDGGKDLERLKAIEKCFHDIWEERYSNISLYSLPSEFKSLISKESSGYSWEELLEEIQVKRRSGEKWSPSKKRSPITLKPHQVDALERWEEQGYHGIYQGCTGCGKTIIAISAIRKMLDMKKTVMVLVPAKELLYHWEKEIRRVIADMTDLQILLCGDGNNAWRKASTLNDWTSPSDTLHKIVIAIMDTASSEEYIGKVYGGEHLFVVADEVHRMGSNRRRNFFSIASGARFGVSATPERYGDSEGTHAILSYFGDILKPPYTLADAIRDKVLTPYFYHPQSVSLTVDEQEEWDNLSREISKRYAISQGKNGSSVDNYLQMLMITRARIIKKAKGKIKKAIEIVEKNYKDGEKWLVYCEDKDQLNKVYTEISQLGIDTYVYYSDMPGDTNATLSYFATNGGVLVSIKCLDEGVDIPATTHALVLASSKNPREFIQRRGRILRLYENKHFSTLYDVIAVPNTASVLEDKSLSIVAAELSRAIEFGKSAENPACITDLQLIALHFGINYEEFLDGGVEDEE